MVTATYMRRLAGLMYQQITPMRADIGKTADLLFFIADQYKRFI
jgi:hypothetical protein